ncbi:hypothetical protein Tco_0594837 [Tanacetum coccineum]
MAIFNTHQYDARDMRCTSVVESYSPLNECMHISDFTWPSISALDQQKAETDKTADVYKEGQEMEEGMAKTNLHQIGFHDVLFDFSSCFDMVHHYHISVQIFYDHINPTTRQTIDHSNDGKLRGRNTEESWELLEDLSLYDNESWNDLTDFEKPFKAISFPQDVWIKSLLDAV